METRSLKTRYIIFYFTAFTIILWVFYTIPSGWIEGLTAQTAVGVLSIFGHTTYWEQTAGYTTLTLLGQHPLTVSIIRECTALNVLGVMAGLILPLIASWKKRAVGIALSGFLLFTLNIPRIVLTIYLTAYDTLPFTLIADRNLETYHYPISFIFGVIGVALTVFAVSHWTTPELADTLIGIIDKIIGLGKNSDTTSSTSQSSL